MISNSYWELADRVKRRLFDRLRKDFWGIKWLEYKEYETGVENTYNSVLDEWERIKKDYVDNPNADFNRLEGFLFETLFYYASLKTQTTFLDAEIIEMNEHTFAEYPPWFEVVPLYDIIPDLHHIWIKGERKRKAPQTKADFLVTYVDDNGPSPPALVDVKKSSKFLKREKVWEEFGWQITAAMRRGFIFQVAYPKHKSGYPKSLKEWEVKTPCTKCKKLSDGYDLCSKCGIEIFPFTIITARYTLKELVDRLNMSYKGRF